MRLIINDDKAFDLASTIECPISKADRTITIDLADMPQAAIEYFLAYGIRQSLNDAAASESKEKGATAETVMAKVEKRLDALRDGSISGVRGRTGDPVKARALLIAAKHVKVVKATVDEKDMFTATLGKHESKSDDRAKAIRLVAANAVDANPAFMHLAQQQIDAEKEIEIDLA